MNRYVLIAVLLVMALAMATPAGAQETGADEGEELAKKLANPIASLISVPLQYNYDQNYGSNDNGYKSLLNIQPVIPFPINKDLNLITRTIIPLVAQHDIPSGSSESGLGDILQSFFLSPKQPFKGWIIGVGPVLLYPSATDSTLGGGKWGAGPTVVALRQDSGWTYGVLFNHVWSFAGQESRDSISSTFMQPFLSYITKTKTTLGINTESTYDWKNEQWSVPLNLTVSQLLMAGKMPLSLMVGVRYWADSPSNGPDGLGFRAGITFLFPQ